MFSLHKAPFHFFLHIIFNLNTFINCFLFKLRRNLNFLHFSNFGLLLLLLCCGNAWHVHMFCHIINKTIQYCIPDQPKKKKRIINLACKAENNNLLFRHWHYVPI